MCGAVRPSRWLFVVVIATLTSGEVPAQHHERKRVERAEIATLEQEWRHAQLSENIPEMDHLLSDEFLGVTASGEVVTKVQQLDRMRTRAMDITRLDLADTKIKISGNLAVVTSLARLDGTSMGHPLSGYFRYTRVYQRNSGDGWKITNFEATRVPSATALNGIIPPAAGSPVSPVSGANSPPASPAGSGSPRPPS